MHLHTSTQPLLPAAVLARSGSVQPDPASGVDTRHPWASGRCRHSSSTPLDERGGITDRVMTPTPAGVFRRFRRPHKRFCSRRKAVVAVEA